MSKRIEEADAPYMVLRRYVDGCMRCSYSKLIYVGKERIPTEGATIFAINHSNTLMDALVLLALDRRPKVFVARADIFKKPALAKVLTFLKIMPIMRKRDGLQEVKKNQETIDRSIEVLKAQTAPFCIFPEGTHQAKFSMLPLSKGICRIAFQAHEAMPEVPLHIVPVGMRYGDFFRFRSTVRVEVGDAIEVGSFLARHADMTPQEQMNELKREIEERLRARMFYIENNEAYEATLELCQVAQPAEVEQLKQAKENSRLHELELQARANKQTLARLEAVKKEAPEVAEKLLKWGEEAKKLREKQGIGHESVSVKRPVWSRMKRILLTLVTLPYLLAASVLALPVIGLAQYICSLLKDPAFKNSARFLMNLFVWPIILLIYTVIACCLLPWKVALVAILLTLPAPYLAHELWATFRLTWSDLKLLQSKKLRALHQQIRKTFTSAKH